MTLSKSKKQDTQLSLYRLLDPEVLANPYPLYQRLREDDPVRWDPFLHAWVVTSYNDVVAVFQQFSAKRTPTPEQLAALGLEKFGPLAQVMVRQMLFLDAPDHTRIRQLASRAFTPRRIEAMRSHIQDITDGLLDKIQQQEQVDIMKEIALPLPAIVTAEMLGFPTSDWQLLTSWSADFAQVLGNFQHNPDHAAKVLHTVEEMLEYFGRTVQDHRENPRNDLITAMLNAEIDGDHLSEEDIIANLIVIMVGGQETTTNLIGNGLLTLLRNPDQMEKLKGDLSLLPSAIEEMLRYESPSQQTARLVPEDIEFHGKQLRKRQAVIAVMAAANRDPERFPDPDRFDISRQDNRHVAFAWAAHFCFGAALARMEAQAAFSSLLRRFPNMQLVDEPIVWRENLGLRGLARLSVKL